MSALSKLKSGGTDRAKVLEWLKFIGEDDEDCINEVLDRCKTDPEARAFYVSCYERDCK